MDNQQRIAKETAEFVANNSEFIESVVIDGVKVTDMRELMMEFNAHVDIYGTWPSFKRVSINLRSEYETN